jgi:hypothetical protein
MNRTTSRIAATVTALFWMGWIALSGTSAATLDIQKKAKAAGIAADNCQYCHVDKLQERGPREQRPGQVAGRGEGQAQGEGSGPRLAQGLQGQVRETR